MKGNQGYDFKLREVVDTVKIRSKVKRNSYPLSMMGLCGGEE
jgi:hypothetical protein